MKGLARAVPWIVLAFLCLAYAAKPDGAAALTIFPAWTWTPIGLIFAAFRCLKDRRQALILSCAWLAYGVAFGEEWRSVARWGTESNRDPATIRVVTLNCAGGLPEAAAEVAAFKPDLVLLQESPGPEDVERLAKRLFGSEGTKVKGPDASILARGPLHALPLPRGTANFVGATVQVAGLPITVISLRLAPPAFRVDLLNPGAWQEVRENRVARRAEIAALARYVDKLPSGPLLMGGDFNCQSGDRSLDAMPREMRDAFYEAGRGWCHTAVNDFPLARIDQIWISPDFRAERLFVRKTVHSDHRMVVCDLRLPTRESSKR
ncbi:MAG: endonuclease/exonuclease/phosphatase family protein [Fimbriimonas sp.]